MRILALGLLLVTLVLPAHSQVSAQSSELTGDWVFDVQTEAGTGQPTFSFKQQGEKLTGTYKGTFGSADLTGSVTGKTFKFSFSADAQGTALTITYSGETVDASTVKGTVDLGGVGTGTFTGSRVKK